MELEYRRGYIAHLMKQYPVTRLEPNGKDHALHAVEQALLDGLITRGEYEELHGYIVQVMYK